jgi:hypothetical protein
VTDLGAYIPELYVVQHPHALIVFLHIFSFTALPASHFCITHLRCIIIFIPPSSLDPFNTFLFLIPCFGCAGVTFCLLPLSLSGKAMEYASVIVLHELARRGPRL